MISMNLSVPIKLIIKSHMKVQIIHDKDSKENNNIRI